MVWCVLNVCDDKDHAYRVARGARMMGVDGLLLVRELEPLVDDERFIRLLKKEGAPMRKVVEGGGTVQYRDCACCGLRYSRSFPEGDRKCGSKYCPCCQLLIQEFRSRYVTNEERINAIRVLLFQHSIGEVD